MRRPKLPIRFLLLSLVGLAPKIVCYSGKRRLQTVTYAPNLVGGDPKGGPRRLRCICAWGGAPSPLAPRTARSPLRKHAKSHSSPLQPSADDTPSRAAHCSLFRASLSFFRELPLLTRPHLAQPLPSSAVSAGNSLFLSLLGVTVATSQPCSGMQGVSKRSCAACARFDPCAC